MRSAAVSMASEIEKQFEGIDAANRWDIEFMNLKRRCDQESRDRQYTLEASKMLDNRKHNRYRDVNPYDHSRIVLGRSAAASTDYINANLVKCERAGRKYILTQGPLPLTVSHFWLMAWEQRSKAILMLNKLVEKKAVKCHKYWPEEIGSQFALRLEDVQLEVEYVKYEEFDHFSIRTLLLRDAASGETRELLQFHYTTWPDFGIPSSPNDFLRFLKMVRDSGAMSDDVGPAIVHCSAGIGRSGTFCLVDCCLKMLQAEAGPAQEPVSVSDVLSELRTYRMGLIQTPDQLYFSYRAIIDGVKYFNDEDWCNTPISSTIKYCEGGEANGAAEEDEAPPPLPPPRTESLQTGPTDGQPSPPTRGASADGGGAEKWAQQPLPMIPIAEHEDDGEEEDEASETDVESCNSDEEQAAEQEAAAKATPEKEGAEAAMNGEEPPEEDLNATEREGLRRRVREEKQQLMAEKVKDIKRKQRELEEGVVASKKRRSLLVKITLAAVLIGFVCICYSRK